MSLLVDATVRRGGFEVIASFGADAGETVALLGPNGSGKSTLVAAIAGLVSPAAGRIVLDGRALDGAGVHVPPERRPIGVVFQELRLFPHLSAVENVAFPLRARGVDRTVARARARTLLERLGVGGRGGLRPRDLSGGEAQRVALARALVAAPELLLLDEPLSALDVAARSRIRDLIREELRRFRGVRVLVTHDPVEAMTLADRMVLLEDGRVTQRGTPEQIRDAPRTHYAADLVGLNFYRGRLEPVPTASGGVEAGVGRLVTAGGGLIVGWPEGVDAGPAIGLLRPADVVLHVEAPRRGSARNVVAGSVEAVAIEGERARVRIRSSPPLVAEITLGSVERLGLREEERVWASFKAVEVRVLAA